MELAFIQEWGGSHALSDFAQARAKSRARSKAACTTLQQCGRSCIDEARQEVYNRSEETDEDEGSRGGLLNSDIQELRIVLFVRTGSHCTGQFSRQRSAVMLKFRGARPGRLSRRCRRSVGPTESTRTFFCHTVIADALTLGFELAQSSQPSASNLARMQRMPMPTQPQWPANAGRGHLAGMAASSS